MGGDSRRRGRVGGLMGRRVECGVLDRLIGVVRAGGSRVLVVRGEPGVGKTAPEVRYITFRPPYMAIPRTWP